jgi:molecular chaperone DnaK
MCRQGDKRMTVTVTRDQFEAMTADLLQRTLDTAELVIEQSQLTAADLDAVVLVGGSTLMPCVPRALEQVTGQKPYDGLSPHTAVAQGAAIHAAILETKHRGDEGGLAERVRKMLASVRQDEVNSHALGVAIRSKKSGKLVNHVMIPKNSPLPVEKQQEFVTHKDGQDRVSVKVMEGDAPDPAACSYVGKCRIEGLPADLPKGSPIEVTYAFDKSGRVKVTAKETRGGKEAEIVVERSGGLNEKQIDAYTRLAASYQVE